MYSGFLSVLRWALHHSTYGSVDAMVFIVKA